MPRSVPEVLVHQAGGRTCEPAVGDRFSQCRPGDVLQLDENGRVAIEVRNREEGSGLPTQHGLLLAKIRHANREDRSGGAPSPNRLMSALLNGRSHAKPFPATNQVRVPCRSPSVTSGNARAIRAASLTVIISVPYPYSSAAEGRAPSLPTWRAASLLYPVVQLWSMPSSRVVTLT
jgi:hypothetical protein